MLKNLFTGQNAISILRIFLVFSTLATAHLIGYVERLGIGVGTFVGLEIAGDLFADFVSAVLWATIISSLLATVLLLIKEVSHAFRFGPNNDAGRATFLEQLRSNNQILLIVAVVFLVTFTVQYLPTTDLFAALGFGVSTFALSLSICLMLASLLIKFTTHASSTLWLFSLTPLLLAVSFYAGELKAGIKPEFRLMQVVFRDQTKLDGYPLHRVTGGIIFRKYSHFSFDVGSVFIPYSAIRLVTEPARDSGGNHVLSSDYPSIVVTAP